MVLVLKINGGLGGALLGQRFSTIPSGLVENVVNEWRFHLQVLLQIVCYRINFMEFKNIDMSLIASNSLPTEICETSKINRDCLHDFEMTIFFTDLLFVSIALKDFSKHTNSKFQSNVIDSTLEFALKC